MNFFHVCMLCVYLCIRVNFMCMCMCGCVCLYMNISTDLYCLCQHHNSSRRLDFSDDSSGATYNSVLGSSEEDEVDESGEVRERERVRGRGRVRESGVERERERERGKERGGGGERERL